MFFTPNKLFHMLIIQPRFRNLQRFFCSFSAHIGKNQLEIENYQDVDNERNDENYVIANDAYDGVDDNCDIDDMTRVPNWCPTERKET